MSFHDELKQYKWADIDGEMKNRTQADVERALGAQPPDLDSLISLLSPAAEPYLEEMAQGAHRLTLRRFGNVINLFAPLYISNVCVNRCAYCGFNAGNPVARLTLSIEQIEAEGRAIRELGFRHLLLVSGEAPKIVTMDYLKGALDALRPMFPSLSIEIFPLDTASYAELIGHGLDGLVVFQETYDEEFYAKVHLGGKKRDFRWRLETPDRGGSAGFRRLGLGALLGLTDWRVEGFFLALHAQYLLRTYWKSQVGISFPRLRPAAGEYQPNHPLSDANFVQLLTALRLFLPDASLVLSTREPPWLRDHLVPLGITTMSAGSHTEPGGYSRKSEGEAQFEVADNRSPAAVAAMLREKGYEPVWKDWDSIFLTPGPNPSEPAAA